MAKTFMIGTRLAIKAIFTDKAGALTDPTTVKFSVKKYPDGVVTEYTYPGAGTSKDGTGIYWLQLKPATSGTYRYRAEGLGALDAAGEGSFVIQASGVLPPPM